MNKRQIKASVASAILGVLSPLAMMAPASAATVNWDGSTNDKFSVGANWSTGSVPGSVDTAVFSGDAFLGYGTQTVGTLDNDTTSLSLAKIVFDGSPTLSPTESVTLSSKSYSITGNNLSLSGGIDAIMAGGGGDHSVVVDVTLTSAQTFKTTGSNTLSVGGTNQTLDLGTNDLTLDASGGTISLLGRIIGSGNIIKAGTGKVLIAAVPGTGGYTGGVSIPAGEIAVNDELGLPVTVSGGTLKGTGTVGAVSMSSGTVAPGNSPGVINTGNLTYTGGNYAVELGGKAAGEFDQTNVTGTV